ncbi:MAG: acetyl-CoA carboxylase carboxyl transferase subunit beta [Chloroflexi bacterium]|nr:acetyl-CoA carboxylase carboxyl transferase subunit beta [Chloroflexota bacterium]
MPRPLPTLLTGLLSQRDGSPGGPGTVHQVCLACGASIAGEDTYQQYRVCPHCTFHYSVTARQRIGLLADQGSFREKYRRITSLDPLSFSSRESYRRRIFRDQKRTGLAEAAVVGTCLVNGTKAVLIVLDFGFMGGSMGSVVGEKVALALELAVKKKLPLLAVVSSGGARVQEGLLSLMQMGKTVVAFNRFNSSGLPYIALLANPATGQVYASFATLADFIMAEPGALVGFAPLRQIQEASVSRIPANFHTAEAHLASGMLDMIVPRQTQREALSAILGLLTGPREKIKPKKPHKVKGPETRKRRVRGWEAVQRARDPMRPTSRDFIERVFDRFVELRGDRLSGDDPSVITGIASFMGTPVMVLAQQRSNGGEASGQLLPEAFHKAQRAFGFAAKFTLPVVSLIDTQGVSPSPESEERGIGYAVATTMAQMASHPAPVVAAIVGVGGGEGALAFGLADRTLMMENAIYSPISPEEAAELFYRDKAKAAEIAQRLRLTAWDCKELGIVDELVPEPGSSSSDAKEEAALLLKEWIGRAMADLQKVSTKRLLKERNKRFRQMGQYGSYMAAALSRRLALRREERERRKRAKKNKEKGLRPRVSALPGVVLEEPVTPDSSSPASSTEASKGKAPR